jgi:hypothetical protein
LAEIALQAIVEHCAHLENTDVQRPAELASRLAAMDDSP